MKKYFIITWLPFFILCTFGCKSRNDYQNKQDLGKAQNLKFEKKTIDSVSQVLSKKIPKGWSCKTIDNKIIVKFNKKVTKINLTSLPVMESEADRKQFEYEDDCIVELKFEKKITNEEYTKLVNNREKLLLDLKNNKNIGGKDKYGKMLSVMIDNPVPLYYFEDFAIYQNLQEIMPTDIFTNNVAKERDSIIKIIESLFKKYEIKL